MITCNGPMKLKLFFSFLFILLSLSVAATAAEEFKDLTTDEVKKMIDGKKKMTLVDARTEAEYREGHIPSAINIPPEKLMTIQKFLPKDKKTPLIFYCRGIG